MVVCPACSTNTPKTCTAARFRGHALQQRHFVCPSGLLGGNVLHLLETAKRQALQRGALCIPCAATLFAVGIEALTTTVAGFDVLPVNQHRWEEGYEAVMLDGIPHKQLTAPRAVMAFDFGGESLTGAPAAAELALDVLRPGCLNAVAFWFELELAPGIWVSSGPARLHCCLPALALQSNGVGAASSGGGAASSVAAQAAPAETAGTVPVQPAATPGSSREGPVCSGSQGACASAAAAAPAKYPNGSHYWGQALQYLDSVVVLQPGARIALRAQRDGKRLRFSLAGIDGKNTAPSASSGAAGPMASDGAPAAGAGSSSADLASGIRASATTAGAAGGGAPSSVPTSHIYVTGAAAPAAVPAPVPAPVRRSPWKEQWGGGSSVDNPHYQRLHYTELILREHLQRLPRRRFPSVEKDLAALQASNRTWFPVPEMPSFVICAVVVACQWAHFCPRSSLHRTQKSCANLIVTLPKFRAGSLRQPAVGPRLPGGPAAAAVPDGAPVR